MHLERQDAGVSTAVQAVGLSAVARRSRAEAGFALAALLVAIAVLSVMLLVALPTWRHQVQREKEAELVFRGEQYARAIGLYQRKLAGAFPPSLDALVEQKFLRKRYKDPITGDDFEPVFAGSAAGMSAMTSALEEMRAGVQEMRVLADSVSVQPGGGSVTLQGRVQVQSGNGRVTASFQSPRAGQPGPGTPSPGGRGVAGPGAATGIVGVRSKSTAQSIRLYNGRDRYDQWVFVYMAVQQQQGLQPGQTATPGRGSTTAPGRGGTPAPGRGRGPF